MQGGGPVEASTLSEDCTGYVAANPSVTVNFQGEAGLLRAFFYSDGDPTLVVRTPDGAYLCGDNTNSLILDPTVEITKPVTGTYDVWVGSTVATDLVPGFLVFTTRSDMDAAKLTLGSLVKRPAAPDFIPLRNRLVNAAERLVRQAPQSKPPIRSKPAAKPSPRTSPPTAICPHRSYRPATPSAAAW